MKPTGNPRAVAVTGLGMVTGLGLGVVRNWSQLKNGACAVKSLLDLPGTASEKYQRFPSKVAAYLDEESRNTLSTMVRVELMCKLLSVILSEFK